jgi:hypothetical protein
MDRAVSHPFRALGVDLPTALSGPWIVLSATLSGPWIALSAKLLGLPVGSAIRHIVSKCATLGHRGPIPNALGPRGRLCSFTTRLTQTHFKWALHELRVYARCGLPLNYPQTGHWLVSPRKIKSSAVIFVAYVPFEVLQMELSDLETRYRYRFFVLSLPLLQRL